MAKKRHRAGRGPGAAGAAAAAAAAAGDAAASGEEPEGEASTEIGEVELSLALRALRWLSAQPRAAGGEVHEALLDAARPLIVLRAAKYEEDAKANKLAEVAAGGSAAVRPGGPGGSKAPNKRPHSAITAPGGEEDAPQGKELGSSTRILRQLAGQSDLLASKACKPLRAALHPLVESHLQEEKASPAFRVTCMLGQRSRWPEALRLLAEMRSLDIGRRPKLGAFQRWVRELDVAEGDAEELAVLDAMMRVAAGLPPSTAAPPSKGSLARSPPWRAVQRPRAAAPASQAAGAEPAAAAGAKAPPAAPAAAEGAEAASGAEAKAPAASTASRLFGIIAARRGEVAAKVGGGQSWSVLAHEAAHARRPPNHFDLDIYTCTQDALPFNSPAPSPVAQHPLPGVEGAFVLSDVLSASECEGLRRLSEAIGYRPDVPLSSALDERAQNVVIMASEEQNEAIFARVRDSLPQELSSERLFGLNRRWRLYRYEEGNLYRKHLDGAWPASGTRVGAGGRQEYVYDAQGTCKSRLTFIVYLNDDFEGGETTFFVPRPSTEGQLEARPVQPLAGCATVFPHGDTGVPLLHEGSSVAKGRKYLLRTDVIYAPAAASEEAREAARLRGLARQLGGLGGKDLTIAKSEPVRRDPESRKAGQTRKVIKRNLKGKDTDGDMPSGGMRESKKPGSKRTSKRNKGKQKERPAPSGNMDPAKKSNRKRDARAASKLKVVGRLQSGKRKAAGSA